MFLSAVRAVVLSQHAGKHSACALDGPTAGEASTSGSSQEASQVMLAAIKLFLAVLCIAMQIGFLE